VPLCRRLLTLPRFVILVRRPPRFLEVVESYHTGRKLVTLEEDIGKYQGLIKVRVRGCSRLEFLARLDRVLVGYNSSAVVT